MKLFWLYQERQTFFGLSANFLLRRYTFLFCFVNYVKFLKISIFSVPPKLLLFIVDLSLYLRSIIMLVFSSVHTHSDGSSKLSAWGIKKYQRPYNINTIKLKKVIFKCVKIRIIDFKVQGGKMKYLYTSRKCLFPLFHYQTIIIYKYIVYT